MKNIEAWIIVIIAVIAVYALFVNFKAELDCNNSGGIMVKQRYTSVCVYRDFYNK